MPVPTDTLYNLDRLNRWFAVSSLGLFASILWIIWVDYDRPWRGFQDDYMVAQGTLAHLAYLETQTEGYQSIIAAARGDLEEARVVAKQRADERAELDRGFKTEKAKLDQVNIEYGNADAVVQVTRSEYEVALSEYGSDAPETAVVRDALDRQESELVALRMTKEGIEDAQKSIRTQIEEIDGDATDAAKRLGKLERVALDAAEKERQYTSILIKSVINAPLLDFTAPKGTPARHEIRQIVLPDVRQELNYLQTYTTDRCTTCHVAIADPSFSRGDLARRFERALPAVNEALLREGKAPLPLPAVPELPGEDSPELEPGRVTEFWDYLSADQQADYFSELSGLINAYLSATGRKEINVPDALLAHPNLDLFVHVDSPHPAARMGCTVCHEGNPQETDFVNAAHTPVDHHQEEEWKEKYYITAAFIPAMTFETVEHYWDRPMHPPKYSEAGCAKCHSRISDISEFRGESQAKSLNLGRDLFTRVGCIDCHHVDEIGVQRKVGPDLRRIAAKLPRPFTESWIFHPKRFRPSTWMPHLFMQENNGPGSENLLDRDPILRTETEVTAIADYLYALSQPWQPEPIPAGLMGDAERGKTLFNEVGCLACHANVAEFGRRMIVSDLQERMGRSARVAEALFEEMRYIDRVNYVMEHLPSDRDTVFAPDTIGDRPMFTRFAPELSSIASKVSREWLFGWLKDPVAYFPETRMPSMRLTDLEALDITEYLLTLGENRTFGAKRFATDDAHTEMADDLVFQILKTQNSERRSRMIMGDENSELTETLVNMLRGYLGEDEARSRLSSMDTRAKKMLFLGNKMIAHYGCYACHWIGGFEQSPPPGTDLSAWAIKPLAQLDFAFFDSAHRHIRTARPEVFGRVYRPEHEELIFWSRGENPEETITHTYAGFARHKMLNPRIWDREKIKGPYDKLKMPNFYFTEQQADALVTYLLSRRPSRVNGNLQVDYDSTLTGAIAEGRNLSRVLNCVGCHKIEGNAAVMHQYHTHTVGGETEFDEVSAPPWLRGEGAKVRHSWLYTFLNQVEMLRPWLKVRMPSFDLTEEETTTLVQYFAGISQRESAVLLGHLKKVDKYVDNAIATAEQGGATEASDGGSWFAADSLRETANYLASYCVKNRLVLKYDVDPALNTVEELRDGYAEVVARARFTADLFDVKFPFADQARPLVDESRFELGEQLFYELQCLACHVLGDPSVEGANPNPSAPNLDLTSKRLGQEWVYQWLQEPGAIQPGTKMPQWFGDGASAFASYPDQDRTELESRFGRTGESQMQLLMDFVYNAGVKNYTALQPGGAPGGDGDQTADGAEGEEDVEEEEEEDE